MELEFGGCSEQIHIQNGPKRQHLHLPPRKTIQFASHLVGSTREIISLIPIQVLARLSGWLYANKLGGKIFIRRSVAVAIRLAHRPLNCGLPLKRVPSCFAILLRKSVLPAISSYEREEKAI